MFQARLAEESIVSKLLLCYTAVCPRLRCSPIGEPGEESRQREIHAHMGGRGGRLRTEDGLPVCVKARLAYYASSKNARSILGQARSTIDLRQTILEGRVLLVSTAQGSAGRDVVALVGESLLNLVDW